MDGNARGGNDSLTTIMFGGSSPFLYGDAASMSGNAQGGNDSLTATDSNHTGSTLVGDAGTMTDSTQGGNDTLTAIDSGDNSYAHLYGDAQSMIGSAQGGNDILNGGEGKDFLWGDASFYSPSSPGSITGGTDTLNGGFRNDELWGGPNDDKFVFDVGSGNDLVHDFNQGNLAVGSMATEHDVIDVHAYGFADWNTLQAAISDVSGNAVIQLSDTDSITLVGVHATDLHQNDFII
jgi:Ca2+-binding RTX toxin-like protein